MITLLEMPGLTAGVEERTVYLPLRPMTFDDFLDRFGEDDDVELIDGVVVERMAAQYDHEKLLSWLHLAVGTHIVNNDLGVLLGSRTAVRITNFRGRLPDMLFVAKARESIITQRAILGAPNLAIEIVSPNDRPSDILAVETDYRNIGVTEFAFIDQRRQAIRLLERQTDGSYTEREVLTGAFTFATFPNLTFEATWFWNEPRLNPTTL